jgi:hypothetical protein
MAASFRGGNISIAGVGVLCEAGIGAAMGACGRRVRCADVLCRPVDARWSSEGGWIGAAQSRHYATATQRPIRLAGQLRRRVAAHPATRDAQVGQRDWATGVRARPRSQESCCGLPRSTGRCTFAGTQSLTSTAVTVATARSSLTLGLQARPVGDDRVGAH